jgi:hypothetical protein
MKEKIIIENLTEKTVGIKRQKYITVNGKEYDDGVPCRTAYINDEKGRIDIQNALSEPYLSAVMFVWGNEATVEVLNG